jgi:hypothetical protein
VQPALPLLLAALAQAVGEGDDDLRRRNSELEARVTRLEAVSLEEAVGGYLARTQADGPGALLPGGLSLRVSGEVRIREELLDRLYRPQDPDARDSFDFAHMRTRLRFDVEVDERVAVVIELQDVRTLGEEGSTTADVEGVDLKRGAILVKRLFERPLALEMGRFVLAYGDQRLIGHLEWFDQGRTYDGARLAYAPERGFLDLFAVRVRETLTPDDDLSLLGVYGGTKGSATLDAEGYALVLLDDRPAAGEVGSGDTRFVTAGTRLFGARDGWDYTGEFALQAGDLRGDDLLAFAFALKGGRTFEGSPWRPRVGFEAAFATGDGDPADGDSAQFQTLFPTNHVHYGYADLFSWSNLLDLKLGVSAQPRPALFVTLDVHHFRLADERGAWVNAGGSTVRPGAAGASRHLGEEIDFTATWKPRKSLAVLFGWSLFLPGGFVSDTGDDPVAHFLYIEVRVVF